ncbi:hypothetical protein QC764_503120 [Podospora pseudoanserina]|uniref:Aminoacyl-transfer RNA synthetases class-II family profile domain-containing protein n=1 Tax=Podospora pseudoanserina TaxID=2609844 RepID=A0ABR0I3S5_9PEZI|nr:hypothetical protein QC764_503120 [Podospora pseudoanserina]
MLNARQMSSQLAPFHLSNDDTDTRSLDVRVHNSPILSDDSNSVAVLFRCANGHFLQATVESKNGLDNGVFDTVSFLTPESLVRVTARSVAHDTDFDITPIELCDIHYLSAAKTPGAYSNVLHGASGEVLASIQSRTKLIEERLDNRLLDARVPATAAIFKLFSGVHELAVEYLKLHDFYHVPTPALVGYEFPGEEDDLFTVPYFGRTARLAPTGEIHLGMALSADLERVYDFHTVFRREPVSDGRHLTEFTMLELVFNLQHSWIEILDFADSLLVSLLHSLQSQDKYTALTNTAKRLYPLAGTFKLGLGKSGKLPRIRFNEAKTLLRDFIGIESDDDKDFTRSEEAALGRFLASEESHVSPPTDVFFITHFPKHLRSCNIYPSDEQDDTTQSFDVILRGQECVTGCRLLHSAEDLAAAFANRPHPIEPETPEWRPYMTAHEIGMPPWGGFGLGINRLVQGFLGLEDIRETVLFPRDAARLLP